MRSTIIVVIFSLLHIFQSKNGPIKKDRFKKVIDNYLGQSQVKNEESYATEKFCEDATSMPQVYRYSKLNFMDYPNKVTNQTYRILIYACNENVIKFDITFIF